MKIFPLNRIWTLILILSALLTAYAIFELFMAGDSYTERNIASARDRAVSEAAGAFTERRNTFTRSSQELALQLKNGIEGSLSENRLYDLMQSRSDLWGSSLFRENEMIIWNGFTETAVPEYPNGLPNRQVVTIHRDNNVTYMRSHYPFYVEELDSLIRYDFISTYRVVQTNILPIGETYEFPVSELLNTDNDYPVNISFFDPIPEEADVSQPLRIGQIDSAGIAYTVPGDRDSFIRQKKNQDNQIRVAFYLMIYSGLILILFYLNRLSAPETAFWIQFMLVSISWAFLILLEGQIPWDLFLPAAYADIPVLTSMTTLGIKSFLTFLLLYSFSKDELYRDLPGWRSLCYLFLGLGAQTFLLYYLSSEVIALFRDTTLSFLDLSLIPTLSTALFYLFCSFALVVILFFGYKVYFGIFYRFREKWWLGWLIAVLFTVLSFTANLYAPLFENLPDQYPWIIAAIQFLMLMSGWIRNEFHEWFRDASRLRWMVISSIILALGIHYTAFEGYSERRDRVLKESAREFVREQESQAEDIADTLLVGLERRLSLQITSGIIEDLRSFEGIFGQTTASLIDPQWQNYSISAQLVDNEGNIIGEYTSSLDSPGWTREFNIRTLEIPFEVERIREENLRPIIRSRPISDAPSSYSAFRRGWIPLYNREGTPEQVGWILCSVYREQPQYEKPLRAVLASQSKRDWPSTINLTLYRDGISSRSTILGTPLELPGYVRLPRFIDVWLASDSLVYRSAGFGDRIVEEFFYRSRPNEVVRAATPGVTMQNHLFSTVRLFFFLFVSGLISMGIFSLIRQRNILDQSRRFRDRLLDRFLIASLFCLMALIFTSNIAINSQNEQNVEDQLLVKISNLAEALSSRDAQGTQTAKSTLDRLASTLDADASLYLDRILTFSTAIQIYEQHLIPDLLPWPVHRGIYGQNNQEVIRRARLGEQELLIGYSAWFNPDRQIQGVAGIPIFLKAPAFNEQFLSITSYLFGVYVIVFGIFIIVASFISSRLTAPLESLRSGLRKISSGNLETTLPVTTKDEIGSLTNAYNYMVDRLKEVQIELAEAEREAAWKEMAQQVAHEIKNPLTPMKLNLQHLEQQLKNGDTDYEKLKPRIRRITENMIEQIESLSQIASDFSKFAKPIQQDFQVLDLHNIIHSVSELYQQDKFLRVQTELERSPVKVYGVKDELRRVLINIIKNAREAMKDYGTITIRTSLSAGTDKVYIEIEDTGEGIDPKVQPNIFVPNFSTKSSGTGLGLAISKKIIEEHNGAISFTSSLGYGTTFTIMLPLKN